MILSQPQIKAEVGKGAIKFDPPLEDRQWGEASVDLRLGVKFTKFRSANSVTFSMAEGIGALADSGLWDEEIFEPLTDKFGKKRSFVLEPNEFILALTYEHVWIPRHLIAMVEGRSQRTKNLQ